MAQYYLVDIEKEVKIKKSIARIGEYLYRAYLPYKHNKKF